MIRQLINLANKLDKLKLIKEADLLDNIIYKISLDEDGKKPPFLRLVGPDEEPIDLEDSETEFAKEVEDPFATIRGVPDQNELEEYRRKQIEWYEAEARINAGSSEGERDALSDALENVRRYKNMSDAELEEDLNQNNVINEALGKFRDYSPADWGERAEEKITYDSLLYESFHKYFSKLVRQYGTGQVEDDISDVYGHSQFDEVFELDDGTVIGVPIAMHSPKDQLFEIMRRNEDRFFEALKGLPLSAIISYLTEGTVYAEPVTDWIHYEDLLKPATEQNPIEAQFIIKNAPDDQKQLKMYLEEYMESSESEEDYEWEADPEYDRGYSDGFAQLPASSRTSELYNQGYEDGLEDATEEL